MGVTQLWQILAPVEQHRPLSSLAGQTLAVDLSIWVCETQSVRQMQGVVSKPFLRNLFFRISHLTQLGVHLVFVIEGTAPELKWEAMMKRQQVRYGGQPGGQGARPRKQTRRNFNACLRECCQLLDILGIPYVQSCGEAEAMCAVLNAAGLVDGCLTNDGDVFLYGATMVYRNFTMNSKDPHVESYSMADIKQQLGIDRDGLVVLGLLLGCDYVPKGVPGVGMANGVKLLQSLRGHNILKRFKAWRTMSDSDCVDKVEAAIRRKALSIKDFPQNKIIVEFLVVKDRCPSSLSPWKRPHVSKFQNFALVKLEWPVEYGLEKVLPLVTLWDMEDIVSTGGSRPHRHLKPHRIVKSRVRQGVPCLEIEWYKPESDTTHPGDYYVTIETQELFGKCFPGIVADFILAMEAKKTKKTSKGKSRKKATAADNIATSAADVMTEVNNAGNTGPIIADAAVLNHTSQVDELSDSLGNLNLSALCDMPTPDLSRVDSIKAMKPKLFVKECQSESANDLANTNLAEKGRLATKITKQRHTPFENAKQDVPKPVCVTGIIGSQSAGIMGKYSANENGIMGTYSIEDRGIMGNYSMGDEGIIGKYSADDKRIRENYSTNEGIVGHYSADNEESMGNYSADDSVFGEVIPLHLRIMRKMNKKSEKNKSSANVMSAVTTDASTGNFRPDSIGCDSSFNSDSNFSLIVNNYVPVHRKGSSPQGNVGIPQTAEMDIEKEELQEASSNRMSYIKCEQDKELSIVDKKCLETALEMGEILEDIPDRMSYNCEHEDLPAVDENNAVGVDGNIDADIDCNHALDSECGDGTSRHILKLNTDIYETDNHSAVSLFSRPALSNIYSHVDNINDTSPTNVPNVLYRDTPGNQTLSNVSYGHFHMSGLCNTLNFSDHSILNTSKSTDTFVIMNNVEKQLINDADAAKVQCSKSRMETATSLIHKICSVDKYHTGSHGNVMQTDDTLTNTSTKSDNQSPVTKYHNLGKNNSREEFDNQICEKLGEITLNDNSIIAGELIDNGTPVLDKPDENKAIQFDAKLPVVMDQHGDSYQHKCVSNRRVAEGNSDQRQKWNTTENVRNSSGTSSETRDERYSKKTTRRNLNRKLRKHLVTKASPLMDFSDDDDENINIHKVSSCADINRDTRIFNETTEGCDSTTAGIQITSTPVDTNITSGHRICEQGGTGLKVKKASPVMDFSANDSVLMGDYQHQHKMDEHEGTGFSKACHKDSKIDHSTSCKPVPDHIPTTSSKSKHAPIMSLSKMERHEQSNPSEDTKCSKLSSQNQVVTEFEVQYLCEKSLEPHSLGSVIDSVEVNLQSLHVKPKSVGIQSQSRIVESKSEIVKSQCEIGKPQSDMVKQSMGVEPQPENVKPKSVCVGLKSRLPQSAIASEHDNLKSHSNHYQPEIVKPKSETEKPKSVCVGLKSTYGLPQSATVSEPVKPNSRINHHQTDIVKPQTAKTSITGIRIDTNDLNESKPVVTSFMKVTTDTVYEGSPVSLSQRLKLRLKNTSTRQVLRDFTNI